MTLGPDGVYPAPFFTFQIKGNFEMFGLERYGLSMGGLIALSFRGKRDVKTTKRCVTVTLFGVLVVI